MKNTNPIELQKKLGIGKYKPSLVAKRLTHLFAILTIILSIMVVYTISQEKSQETTKELEICTLQTVYCGEEIVPEVKIEEKRIIAKVTGYNTVPEQTDFSPCISADGSNICGRNDTVACPRSIELGTWVTIDGKDYECTDRTAKKFDARFDINCDKDFECPYKVTGTKEIIILN